MVELCDDVVMEIFLRVPVESVFRFKCLSKGWNHRLSHDSFRNKYQIRQTPPSYASPLFGLFQGTILYPKYHRDSHLFPRLSFLPSCCIGEGKKPLNFIPKYHRDSHLFPRLSFLPSCCIGEGKKPLNFIDKLGFIVGSSNGLILCGYHPNTYYVCNPITDQWFELPEPNNKALEPMHVVIGFLYHDRNYKVVRAHSSRAKSENKLWIETYSSDTGVWKESTLRGAGKVLLDPWHPSKDGGGVIYWMGCGVRTVVAYDPNALHDWLWLIKLPCPSGIQNIILGETGEGLLLYGTDEDPPGMTIYTLGKQLHCYSYSQVIPANEWIPIFYTPYNTPILNHPVSISDPLEEYPLLIAFHPQNYRFVLMRVGECVFWFDLETGGASYIEYEGVVILGTMFELFPYFRPDWPPSPLPRLRQNFKPPW